MDACISQKGTPRFLKETLRLSHKLTDALILIRMDSGNDAKENFGILLEDGNWFIVKRNPRGWETKDEWFTKVRQCCKDIRTPRDGKVVYEVIERTIDKYGQILSFPDIELNTWWTNLDWKDDDIIASYHAHGESEQYYSEIKTDMDVERLPSGEFETNELVLELTVL